MSRYDDYDDYDDRPVRKSSSGANRERTASGERRPSGGARPSGSRPSGSRPSQGGSRPSGSRPSQGGSRPSGSRSSGGSRPSGSRPSGARPQGGRPSGRPPQGGRPSGRRDDYSRGGRKKKSPVGKIILFIIELAILAVAGFFLYMTLTATKTGKVEIEEEKIIISDTVKEAEETTMKGYRNIALFGVDSRASMLDKKTRTDTIIIASINQDTGDIKLVSVYRDTYLNLGNDTYNKCNVAYAKGGPEQAINMLNTNLDMNITDFVTIGFEGLIDVIDALGGVEIDIQDAEIEHLNNYQRSMFLSEDGSGKLNENIVPVTTSGVQTLSGLQATAYCRIRYTKGDDFRRAERQRTVLMKCMEKAKNANITTLTQIANSVFDKTYTSLDLDEIIELLGDINKYQVVGQGGFPDESLRTTGTIGSKGSCVVPVTLSNNVKWLHWFLFDDEPYTPSDVVEKCSEQIYQDTHTYVGN